MLAVAYHVRRAVQWLAVALAEWRVRGGDKRTCEAWAAYRLKAWPDMVGQLPSAAVYRALSVMTTRSVTAAWFARQVGCDRTAAQDCLDRLVADGVATVTRHWDACDSVL